MATSDPAAGGRNADSHAKKERLRVVRSATASFSIRSPRALATWLDSTADTACIVTAAILSRGSRSSRSSG